MAHSQHSHILENVRMLSAQLYAPENPVEHAIKIGSFALAFTFAFLRFVIVHALRIIERL